jgi:quercetin dioxygenase-like cupin family protein
MNQTLIAIVALSVISTAAVAEDFPPLQRVPVLEEAIPSTNPAIKMVRGARIRFAPRQTTGLHRHPISITGVVTAGSFVFKREGEAEKIIKTGECFFEAAGVTTERFDNASSTEPPELIAFYLTDSKDRALIEMLGTK